MWISSCQCPSFFSFIYSSNAWAPAACPIWARCYLVYVQTFLFIFPMVSTRSLIPSLGGGGDWDSEGERRFPTSHSGALVHLFMLETSAEFLLSFRRGARDTAVKELDPCLKTLTGHCVYLYLLSLLSLLKSPSKLVHVGGESLPLPSSWLSEGVAFFRLCGAGPAQGWADKPKKKNVQPFLSTSYWGSAECRFPKLPQKNSIIPFLSFFFPFMIYITEMIHVRYFLKKIKKSKNSQSNNHSKSC